MPRFYIHMCDATGFVEDTEGQELADVDIARRKAVEGLRSVLAEELQGGDLNTASFIEIEDERHELVATISFADVVSLTNDAPARPPRQDPRDAG